MSIDKWYLCDWTLFLIIISKRIIEWRDTENFIILRNRRH
jgi:hypothetical protein